MDTDRPFPCLDGHKYSGCLGQDCWAERCWNGRRVRLNQGVIAVRADAFDRPLRVIRYTSSDCANCIHAVDLQPDFDMRSPGGRLIKRWAICEQGLWAAPASLYNLLNHRVPLRRPGPCPSFAERPLDQMRPELARQRQADRARASRRRARLREAKMAQAQRPGREAAA